MTRLPLYSCRCITASRRRSGRRPPATGRRRLDRPGDGVETQRETRPVDIPVGREVPAPFVERVPRVPRKDDVRLLPRLPLRAELERLQARLAEPALYTDTGRKDEITGLLREQAACKASLATLESDWLEASDALERAVAGASA